MGMSVSMTGMAEVLGNLAELQTMLPEEITAVQEDVGQQTVDLCQQTSPVRTGEMRDGFAYEVSNGVLTVYNPVEHSLYVEMGTYKMAAQPTLYPAFAQMGSEFLNECRAI